MLTKLTWFLTKTELPWHNSERQCTFQVTFSFSATDSTDDENVTDATDGADLAASMSDGHLAFRSSLDRRQRTHITMTTTVSGMAVAGYSHQYDDIRKAPGQILNLPRTRKCPCRR
jgi:hypothetical protein